MGVHEQAAAGLVLDLAAGTGRLTRVLVKHAREVIAVEPGVMDRELLLASMSSHSSIGTLPPDRLAAAMAAVTEVAEHHGIDHATIPICTLIYTAQKRSGESGPSAG